MRYIQYSAYQAVRNRNALYMILIVPKLIHGIYDTTHVYLIPRTKQLDPRNISYHIISSITHVTIAHATLADQCSGYHVHISHGTRTRYIRIAFSKVV